MISSEHVVTENVLAPEIVEAVADAEGDEPAELDFTLYEHVEPGAIELLAANETATRTLTFQLPNHDVTVTSDGRVLVDGARRARSRTC